ncbi:choloylglycine hydrolase family protein [Staphylococcus sp. Marseille-Q5304]|uniref:choloylglycine hydrolase family protein n=1 Tax=Staphylococcus sp. Marseille-Q5304 TaxID=2942200 RepID=UPI0020740F6C|nr:choloylglycine hydrolase family protein [Staphylococcus sp. Marseille-Q5304]
MCTGFSVQSVLQHNYLARTMDFAFESNNIPIVVPTHYNYEFEIAGNQELKYGFVGTAMMVGQYRFSDGVNEQGLAISNHYFSRLASYTTNPREGYFNVGPEEFILWLLGFNNSIATLKQNIAQVNIVAIGNKALDNIPPLHFIVTDKTGETVTIEPHNGLLVVKENPVHVLTNSPNLEWHYENLKNFTHISPQQHQQKQFGERNFEALGNAGGTFGLPGGFTSSERFVRAAYLRQHLILEGRDINQHVNQCFKVLDNVSVPYGAIKENGETHYTQFQCVLDCKHQTYYIKPYDSSEVFEVQLCQTLLEKDTPTYFSLEHKFKTHRLN